MMMMMSGSRVCLRHRPSALDRTTTERATVTKHNINTSFIFFVFFEILKAGSNNKIGARPAKRFGSKKVKLEGMAGLWYKYGRGKRRMGNVEGCSLALFDFKFSLLVDPSVVTPRPLYLPKNRTPIVTWRGSGQMAGQDSLRSIATSLLFNH
jgi:hypothetical protein